MNCFKAVAVLLFCVAASSPCCRFASAEEKASPSPAPAEFRDEFLNLCDMARDELNKEITPYDETYRTVVEPKTHHMPFFEDAYAVRALAVAYDITGKQPYLDACKHWADRVIALQEKMTPKGAYYLNYGRAPGATSGDWWVADSGSVAMAILATAARVTDKAEKDRYLNSVKSFAKLVLDNYVSKDGGITDGLWSHYDGPWWCSTATFSAAAYLLYDETGDPQYLKTATGGTDWLAAHDFRKNDPPAWDAMGGSPGVVFYIGESHAVALGHRAPDDARRKAVAAQVAQMSQWMKDNQQGRGAKNDLNYLKGATYMAGLPYLMYAFAGQLPEHRDLDQAGDQELRYVHGLLFKSGNPPVSLVETWEVMTWAMMSYAERLCPGALFRARGVRPDAP